MGHVVDNVAFEQTIWTREFSILKEEMIGGAHASSLGKISTSGSESPLTINLDWIAKRKILYTNMNHELIDISLLRIQRFFCFGEYKSWGLNSLFDRY
jgi:hypothetical protein